MSIIDRAKEAFDTNADGKVEAKEVAGVVAERVKDTAAAAAVAAGEVKQGFDADGDGKVSLDEVKVVGQGIAAKASGAFGGVAEKLQRK